MRARCELSEPTDTATTANDDLDIEEAPLVHLENHHNQLERNQDLYFPQALPKENTHWEGLSDDDNDEDGDNEESRLPEYDEDELDAVRVMTTPGNAFEQLLFTV